MLSSDLKLPDGWQELVDVSRQVRKNAHSPYSNYQVGCALRTLSGRVFTGCNVENATYGLTICAERSAACAAVAAGEKQIQIACISLTGVPVPCGMCRQFLTEFNPEMTLLLDNLDTPDEPPEVVLLSELLPRAFRL